MSGSFLDNMLKASKKLSFLLFCMVLQCCEAKSSFSTCIIHSCFSSTQWQLPWTLCKAANLQVLLEACCPYPDRLYNCVQPKQTCVLNVIVCCPSQTAVGCAGGGTHPAGQGSPEERT